MSSPALSFLPPLVLLSCFLTVPHGSFQREARAVEAKRLAEEQAARAAEALAAQAAAEALAKQKELERIEELRRIADERTQEEAEQYSLVRAGLLLLLISLCWIARFWCSFIQNWKRPDFNLQACTESIMHKPVKVLF